MTQTTVRHFMTDSPHTIGHDQTLNTARRFMRKHRIRHLPVLEAGKLVGLVSQRDLQFIDTLIDVDPNQVTVREAMSPDVFAVKPRTSIRRVAAEMAKHKYGSAVVVEGSRVIGVFTTVDALRALSALLASQPGSRVDSAHSSSTAT